MTKPAFFQCVLCEATSKGTAVIRSRSDRSICAWCESELRRTNRGRCRKCNGTVPIAELGKHPKHCPACRSARNRAYYQADPERAQQRSRDWYAADAERRKAARRRSYARRPEPVKAARRAYYQRYRERENAYRRARYQQQPERYAAYRERHAERIREYARTYRIKKKLAILRGWKSTTAS